MKSFASIIVIILTLLMSYLWIGQGLSQLHLSAWISVILSFILVLIPGGTLAISLDGSRSWIRFFSYGFPISLALIGVIGLIARSLHWTIDLINLIWFSFSILGIIWLFWQQRSKFHRPQWKVDNWLVVLGSILVLVIVAIFAYQAVVRFHFFKDILIYNSEVTYFASGIPLDWQEIHFNTGNLISDRFYFSYWTLFQALVVHISGIHILQAQYIYSAIIIFLLGAAIYTFGRDVGFSQSSSLVIVLLTFACYSILIDQPNLPGIILINYTLLDKEVAEFVLYSTVMGVTYKLTTQPSHRLFLLFILTLSGILFTHPIALGLTILTIGLWMGISILSTRNLFPYVQVIVLCAIVIAPLIIVRLLTQSDNLYDFGDNPVSYGIVLWVSDDQTLYAPLVKATGVISYILLIVSGIVSLIRIKQPLYRLMLSISVVVGIGLFPYTAWFYGRLVGTENIWRNVWVVPYGLMAFAVFVAIGDAMQRTASRFRIMLPNMHFGRIGLTILVLIASSVLIIAQLSSSFEKAFTIDTAKKIHQFDELIEVGQYIESQHHDQVTILGDDEVTNILPIMSIKSRTLMFFKRRQMVAFSQLEKDEADDRENRQIAFFSTAVPQEQLETLDMYNITYILYKINEYGKFVDPLLEDFPDLFEVAFELDEYRLLRYVPLPE